MVVYSFYESDSRVIMYTSALVEKGYCVDVISLQHKNQLKHEVLNGVNVFRIQKRITKEKSKYVFLFRLVKFLLKSFLFLTIAHIKKPYDLIHVHSVPDFEVFSALIPKILGTKIILDIHDIVPEFYSSKFGTMSNSLIFKLLVLVEKLSIKFSNHVIIANHIWYQRLISRSVSRDKCSVIINYPVQSIFYKRQQKRKYIGKKTVLIYPGTLNWHQGLDIAIKAFSLIQDRVSHTEFHIYGDGPTKDELIQLSKSLGVKNRIMFHHPVSIERISSIIANSDIGIVPKRNDSFGGEAFSTKILEFMSLGVPAIVSKTKIDSYYFNDDIVKFFEPDNPSSLAQAMFELINDRSHRQVLSRNGREFVDQNNWTIKKYLYLDLVSKLVNSKT